MLKSTDKMLSHSSQVAIHLTVTSVGRPHPQFNKKCQPAPHPAQVHSFQTTTLTGSPPYPDYCEKAL